MSEQFAIAQVTPYPWEQGHDVNRYVERVAEELRGRGHRVVIVAPSDSRKLVRDGLEYSGFHEVGLLSLSSADHSEIGDICSGLAEQYAGLPF